MYTGSIRRSLPSLQICLTILISQWYTIQLSLSIYWYTNTGLIVALVARYATDYFEITFSIQIVTPRTKTPGALAAPKMAQDRPYIKRDIGYHSLTVRAPPTILTHKHYLEILRYCRLPYSIISGDRMTAIASIMPITGQKK
jgi:hypothetical protein